MISWHEILWIDKTNAEAGNGGLSANMRKFINLRWCVVWFFVHPHDCWEGISQISKNVSPKSWVPEI